MRDQDQRCAPAGCRECGNCPDNSRGPDRRAFVAQSLFAAAGLVFTSACGDGEIGGPLGPGTAPPLGGTLVVTLSDFPALADVGGTARVDGNTGTPVAVTRTGATSFVALSMVCPHASYKPIQITAFGFRCPNHGAEFDEVGDWIGGQRTRDLRAYSVVYDAPGGTLTIS